MRVPFRDSLRFTEGLNLSHPPQHTGDYAVTLSNLLPTAAGNMSPFQGLTIQSGKVGSPLMFNVGADYFGLGNKASASTAKGSIFGYIGESVVFIGAGELYRNGVRFQAGSGPSNVDAATTMKIVLKRAGIYTGSGTGPYLIGINVPQMPTIGTIACGVDSTKMRSAVSSFKITAVRSTTGGDSNATQATPVVTHDKSTIPTLTFAAIGADGEDEFDVYATKQSEGKTGPQFYLRTVHESTLTASESKTCSFTNTSPIVTLTVGTVTRDHVGMRVRIADFDGVGGTFTSWIRSVDPVPGSTTSTTLTLAHNLTATGSGKTATVDAQVGGTARTLAIEWSDGDLEPDTAPFDHNKPPTGVFGFVLHDCMAVVGCDGDATSGATASSPGTNIAYSKAGFPEAFPVENRIALPEKPTAVISRPAEGLTYVFCANSTHVIEYDGGPNPLKLTTLWNNRGVARQHNAVLVEGDLYAYVGGRSFIRYSPQSGTDDTFASPVSTAFVLSVDLRLGYDQKTQTVVYGNAAAGAQTGYTFNRASGAWGSFALGSVTGFTFGGGDSVVSSYVLDGQLYLVYNRAASSDYEIYSWNVGSGSTWQILSPFREGEVGPLIKTLTRVRVALSGVYSGTVETRVYRNLQTLPFPAASSTSATLSVASGNGQHVPVWKCNVKGCQTYAVQVNGIGSGGTIYRVDLNGVASPITV